MRRVLEDAGLADRVACDSAGTIDFHRGKSPDPRMRRAAAEHGYTFEGRARPVTPMDLESFDLILAMDRENLADILALDSREMHREKVRLFASFCGNDAFPDEVPDPYYGGESGFHHVIKMVENGCAGVLEWVGDRLGERRV